MSRSRRQLQHLTTRVSAQRRAMLIEQQKDKEITEAVDKEERKKALDDLTKLSQEMGLYEN